MIMNATEFVACPYVSRSQNEQLQRKVVQIAIYDLQLVIHFTLDQISHLID